MKERNASTKRKSPKQILTSAKDILTGKSALEIAQRKVFIYLVNSCRNLHSKHFLYITNIVFTTQPTYIAEYNRQRKYLLVKIYYYYYITDVLWNT